MTKDVEVQKSDEEGEYTPPRNTWVSGEDLRRMMEYYGITREDLKPLVIVSFDDEVGLGVEGFPTGEETLRNFSAYDGLDGDQVSSHFYEHVENFFTKF